MDNILNRVKQNEPENDAYLHGRNAKRKEVKNKSKIIEV